MNKKEKRLSIAGLVLSIFLLLCAVINFVRGHIGAAIGALGAGIFFMALSQRLMRESKEIRKTNGDTTSDVSE